MNIVEQAKQEYATLSLQLEGNPIFKKLRALEALIYAYGERNPIDSGVTKPVNGHTRLVSKGGAKGAALQAAEEFITQNGGAAEYGNILEFVSKKTPITKKRLSVYMSASGDFKYNKEDKQWRLAR